MSATTSMVVVIFLGAGASLGWYASRAYAAHGDVKSTKKKIPGFRRARKSNGMMTVILAVVVGVIVLSMIGGHHH